MHCYAIVEGLMLKVDYGVTVSAALLGELCAKESDEVYITPCIYCGMPANSIDHIPSRHMRRQFSGINAFPAARVT